MAVWSPVSIGSCAVNHGGIEVDTGHIQSVSACQLNRQVARAATHLEHTCPIRCGRGDVGSDLPVERAEHEPAHQVVTGGMADEDTARYRSAPTVSHHGDRCSDCA